MGWGGQTVTRSQGRTARTGKCPLSPSLNTPKPYKAFWILFREYVDTNLPDPRLMYAYHYQNADTELLFRYDNATHRPPLSQKEHKHTPSGVQISPAPTLAQVLDEILA